MSSSSGVTLYRAVCLALVLAGWSSMHEVGFALTLAAAGALLINPARLLDAATPSDWTNSAADAPVLSSAGHASDYDLGYAHLRAGRLDDAVALLQLVVTRDEFDADAHFHLGSALMELKRDAAAVAALERAVCVRPSHAEAHERLGQALLRLDRVAAAQAALAEALRLRPQLSAARRSLERLDDSMASRRLTHTQRAAATRSKLHSRFGPRAA